MCNLNKRKKIPSSFCVSSLINFSLSLAFPLSTVINKIRQCLFKKKIKIENNKSFDIGYGMYFTSETGFE